jgi:hypothetical protein
MDCRIDFGSNQFFVMFGGKNMYLKVIYPDGTAGTVISSTIDVLIKQGKIVAFKCSEGWVEVRRKLKGKFYFGKDRRRSNLVHR